MFESIGILNYKFYLLAVFALIVVPGPNSLFVLATAIKSGAKKASRAMAAVFVGDYTLMILSYIGIAAIIHRFPILFTGLKIFGGCYLFFLSAQIFYSLFLQKRQGDEREVKQIKTLDKNPFKQALVLSLTNPKALLFFLSFFPAFIDASYKPTVIPFLVLTLTLQCVSMIYLSCLILMGAKVLSLVKHIPLLGFMGNFLVMIIFFSFSIWVIFSDYQ